MKLHENVGVDRHRFNQSMTETLDYSSSSANGKRGLMH